MNYGFQSSAFSRKGETGEIKLVVGEVIGRNLGATFIMKVKGHRLKAADGIKPRDYEIKVKLDMQKAIRILSSYGIKEFPFEFDSNLSVEYNPSVGREVGMKLTIGWSGDTIKTAEVEVPGEYNLDSSIDRAFIRHGIFHEYMETALLLVLTEVFGNPDPNIRQRRNLAHDAVEAVQDAQGIEQYRNWREGYESGCWEVSVEGLNTVRIRFVKPPDRTFRLAIYDSEGNRVDRILVEQEGTQWGEYIWGENQASGEYTIKGYDQEVKVTLGTEWLLQPPSPWWEVRNPQDQPIVIDYSYWNLSYDPEAGWSGGFHAEVYDIAGNQVDELLGVETGQIKWGESHPGGVYFIKAKDPNATPEIIRVTLLPEGYEVTQPETEKEIVPPITVPVPPSWKVSVTSDKKVKIHYHHCPEGITLRIHDLTGKEHNILDGAGNRVLDLTGKGPSGTLIWDWGVDRSVYSGLYFLKINSGSLSKTDRVTLVR